MNILKTFASAERLQTPISEPSGNVLSTMGVENEFLSAKQIKAAAKASVGIPSVAEEIQIRYLVCQIEMIERTTF